MANPSLQIGNSNWAIKKDNLLGYSTAGTRFLPIPITMTRASAGTRVNPQGLVETVELLGSEEVTDSNFLLTGTQAENTTGTYWTTGTGWTISGGTANSVTNAGSTYLTQTAAVTSGKTYLVKFTVTNYDSGNIKVGVSGSEGTIRTANGTYTEVLTASGSSVFAKSQSGSFVGSIDNVSVKESTTNDLARVDYTGSTSSLLAEPERTNLDTTSASGTYGSTPTSEISAIAPDGENTAIRPVPGDASNRYQYTLTGGTYSSGDVLTYSWYRKRFSTPTGSVVTGDLDIKILVNCTQVGVTTEIASSINGYDRFSATVSITDGSLSSILRFYFGNVIEVGNSSVAYWGHQLEQGSYATSYITTDGSTVTRVQDQYSKTGISDKIGAEGVLFIEMAALSNDLTNRVISLNDGTGSNRLMLYFNSGNNTIAVAGLGGTISYVVTDETAFNKMAVRYKTNDITLWVDGESRGTPITSVTIPTFTALKFDSGSGGSDFYGKVKQLQIYDTYLSNGDMQTLTE
mgnify:CR=1 FL=1